MGIWWPPKRKARWACSHIQEGGGGSAYSELQLFGGGRRPIVAVVVIELRRAGGAHNRYRSYFFWVKVAEVFAPKGGHTHAGGDGMKALTRFFWCCCCCASAARGLKSGRRVGIL